MFRDRTLLDTGGIPSVVPTPGSSLLFIGVLVVACLVLGGGLSFEGTDCDFLSCGRSFMTAGSSFAGGGDRGGGSSSAGRTTAVAAFPFADGPTVDRGLFGFEAGSNTRLLLLLVLLLQCCGRSCCSSLLFLVLPFLVLLLLS